MVIDTTSDGSTFDASDWPFFWLTHASGLYVSRLETRLKKVVLDVPRWRVLMCIRPGEACSVSEISHLAIIKLPTTMKLVQRMASEGLVQCRARESDGRVTEVSLTGAGEQARKLAWQTAAKIFAKVFPGGVRQDLAKLNSLLQSMVERLKDDD